MVAPASDSRSPPSTLDSLDWPSAPASAAIWPVSSPWCPATAQAMVSSRTLRQCARTRSGIASWLKVAANCARSWVVSPIVLLLLEAKGIYHHRGGEATSRPPHLWRFHHAE